MRLIDVSHVVADGMTTYPGLPGPRISDHLSWEASRSMYAPGTEFQIGRIEMVANTGTYLDTPAHRHRDGWDLAELPLEKVALVPLTLVDAPGPAIGAPVFDGHVLADRAVVVRTGWSRHWGTEAYGAGGHPHLTADAAQALVDAGARLVGIDSVNIDATATGDRPAHTILLGAGIPIVEHLCNLDAVPATPGDTFTAVPVKVAGMATFPVRAFVTVPDA
ncbi:MAG TPA: cyclase family protein [Acidimicrobiales bacterium]